MRNRLTLLKTSDTAQWLALLQRATAHDVYHRPDYHRNAELSGEGTAYLLHYQDGSYSILLPLLLRSLAKLDALGDRAAGWNDATSVYGYAGPIASHRSVPASVRNGFHDALRGAVCKMKVVSLFARLHPLLQQEDLLAGLGEFRHPGETVSIDLRAPADEAWKQYRSNHKRDVTRLSRMGATVIRDTKWSYFDDFVRLYQETIDRHRAAPYYCFPKRYFERFATTSGINASLFACLHNRRPVCCGLFTQCNGIVQYHYAGTADDSVQLSPLKLVLHHVQTWAARNGSSVLHLGGGLGGRRDSLFHFKAGFSPSRHRFTVWRWICEPAVYRRLTELRRQSDGQSTRAQTPDGSFPAYRVHPPVGVTARWAPGDERLSPSTPVA